ncbi:hypothetical protein [Nocardioides sp. AE5]|uniref:divisome protein SepX/GlpR n=1 Tax=Nocardioides sp. AE5 TaxID=2962573 RepID=UPI002882B101|nr:hypothetical protein [Nocardioides sp. AE5]MDT0203102.1 hypothetical protein [Nocardioides sp. AE5]
MDLSGIIFVALAIAWAVYLIPKALRHHDEVARSRSVDRFSNTMRVLARREPVGATGARLVVQPGRGQTPATVTVKGSPAPVGETARPRRPSRGHLAARREAARVAAQRRRRVLGTVLGLNLLVAGLALGGVVGWPWVAAPVALLVAWLVACRLMVRQEIAADTVLVGPPVRAEEAEQVDESVPASYDVDRNEQGFDEVAADADTSVMAAVDAELWDPVPVTLPTYVTKPAAVRRSVRTIDLGEDDVWTSGHSEESTALAREADAAARGDEGDQPRVVNG